MKILVTGDIHANYEDLNDLIKDQSPELVLVCGDFGYWPKFYDLKKLKVRDTKVLWCDGNHEDFWSLKERTSDEIMPNVFYMPRGSTYTLPDGKTILFMGGAESIDRYSRVEGVSWFPEEIISPSDVLNVPVDLKIDIVISHTCPYELLPIMIKFNESKSNDPSNKALSYILETFQPKLWYFGHWHVYISGSIGNEEWTTDWTCLDCTKSGGKWWTELETIERRVKYKKIII